MSLDTKEIEAIKRYLLGLAPDEERAQFEERLLSDGDFFQDLIIGEEELIDQYLAGQLSESDRRSLETNFLITRERREKLRFAQSLRKYIGDNALLTSKELGADDPAKPQPAVAVNPPKNRAFFSFLQSQNPLLSYGFAVALVLVIVGASWIAVRNLRTDHRAPANVLTVVLTPGMTREGGETKRISFPPDTNTLQLRLEVPPNRYQSYRADLLNDDGKIIWSKDETLSAVEPLKSLDLSIDRKLLSPGDYQVKLSGRLAGAGPDGIGLYSFRITP